MSADSSISDAAFSGAPVLTGLELFERAGACAVLEWCDFKTGLYQVSFPEGEGVISAPEWMAYKVWCRAAERVDPLSGAPSISMMVVEAEEEARAVGELRVRPDDRQRIYRSLSTVLGEVLTLVGAARVTLCADDEESALDEAERKLEVCRVCVQGLLSSESSELIIDAEDELEALNLWHKEEAETCVEDLLRGVPVHGGNASRNDLRNLILSAFLSGAVEQFTRPFIRGAENTEGTAA